MDQDEARERTVQRFLECEAKRAEARAALLAVGRYDTEVRVLEHEAAKAHWNVWAEDMRARRKALKKSGVRAAERSPLGLPEPKNDETRAWMWEARDSLLRVPLCFKGERCTGRKERRQETCQID